MERDGVRAAIERYGVESEGPAPKLVAVALAEAGPATRKELVEETGLSYSAVYYAVEKMLDNGSVETRASVVDPNGAETLEPAGEAA